MFFGHKLRISRKHEQRHGRRAVGPELLTRLRGSGDGGIHFQMEREGAFSRFLPATSDAGDAFFLPSLLSCSLRMFGEMSVTIRRVAINSALCSFRGVVVAVLNDRSRHAAEH